MSRASVATWLDTIRPGDVVRFKSGALRTVLVVSHRPDGRLHSARFAIKRCSWTQRGHTILGRRYLLDRLECKTRAHIDIKKYPLAVRLLEDLDDIRAGRFVPRTTCCDVVGVFE